MAGRDPSAIGQKISPLIPVVAVVKQTNRQIQSTGLDGVDSGTVEDGMNCHGLWKL